MAALPLADLSDTVGYAEQEWAAIHKVYASIVLGHALIPWDERIATSHRRCEPISCFYTGIMSVSMHNIAFVKLLGQLTATMERMLNGIPATPERALPVQAQPAPWDTLVSVLNRIDNRLEKLEARPQVTPTAEPVFNEVGKKRACAREAAAELCHGKGNGNAPGGQ